MKQMAGTHRAKMRAVKTEKRVDKGLKMKGATFNKSKKTAMNSK